MFGAEQIAYRNKDAVSPGVFSFAEVDILLAPIIKMEFKSWDLKQ
jgi:hypothetical protein